MNNKKWYLQGIKDGTPIALGYFAVGFTLGIAAKAMGMGPAQSGLMSFLMHASAGEFAVLTVIADNAGSSICGISSCRALYHRKFLPILHC